MKFEYIEPLRLERQVEALKTRKGRDGLYRLFEDYTVRVNGVEIAAPEGMLTDLSSVPRWAWSISGVGRVGPHLEASIIHDWLYIEWQHNGTEPTDFKRKAADDIFLAGMEAAGVGKVRRWLIYKAVRLGGRSAYYS